MTLMRMTISAPMKNWRLCPSAHSLCWDCEHTKQTAQAAINQFAIANLSPTPLTSVSLVTSFLTNNSVRQNPTTLSAHSPKENWDPLCKLYSTAQYAPIIVELGLINVGQRALIPASRQHGTIPHEVKDLRSPGLMASAQTILADMEANTEIGTAICNLTNFIEALNCSWVMIPSTGIGS